MKARFPSLQTNLICLRLANRQSPAQLGDVLGVSTLRYTQIEAGKIEATPEQIKALADHYELSVVDLNTYNFCSNPVTIARLMATGGGSPDIEPTLN